MWNPSSGLVDIMSFVSSQFFVVKCNNLLPIVLLVIVQAWRIRALKILMRTNITKTSMELFQSPNKKINTHVPFSYRFNQSVQGRTRHLKSAWRRMFFGGLWNSFMEVLVILVRIRIFKSPNSSCLNYY